MGVWVGEVEVGGEGLVFLGGPCVIEEVDELLRTAEVLRDLCAERGVGFVCKASFDKANRTSGASFRGPGLDKGLEALARVRSEVGVPVTTDVHEVGQVRAVAEVVDLLQVPALLSRQTDLVVACAGAGRPVNLKKGQFMAPGDMAHVVAKAAGAPGVLVTERGSCFGYRDLVVDFRGVGVLKGLGVPVVFDATHSVQRPGALGDRSGGCREATRPLARAAVAAGVDAVFAEVHPEPGRARSDGAVQVALGEVGGVLDELVAVWEAVRG